MDSLARIFTTLEQLIGNLALLGWEILQLGAYWALLILWVAWWIGAVDWRRAWPVLGRGGWAPLVLLWIAAALVWSRISPSDCPYLANFWWQLGYVGMLLGIALICGWLQGVFGWAPAEISFDPPAHHDDHGHGHGHDHHGHDAHAPNAPSADTGHGGGGHHH
jgi:hypothetical protein